MSIREGGGLFVSGPMFLPRGLPDRKPPWTETPWTESPLDRDPPGRRPLDKEPPGQRVPWTETPWTKTPWTEILLYGKERAVRILLECILVFYLSMKLTSSCLVRDTKCNILHIIWLQAGGYSEVVSEVTQGQQERGSHEIIHGTRLRQSRLRAAKLDRIIMM